MDRNRRTRSFGRTALAIALALCPVNAAAQDDARSSSLDTIPGPHRWTASVEVMPSAGLHPLLSLRVEPRSRSGFHPQVGISVFASGVAEGAAVGFLDVGAGYSRPLSPWTTLVVRAGPSVLGAAGFAGLYGAPAAHGGAGLVLGSGRHQFRLEYTVRKLFVVDDDYIPLVHTFGLGFSWRTG